jgi:thiamine-monophosphate kinase
VIVADLTEGELVERIQERLPKPPAWLTVGIGDDAAVVEPERNRLEVLSVDALVEGVHFDRRFTPPEAIGHRALAVNLSDLAAMGASPRLALLSLAMPSSLPVADFDRLVAGLAALADTHRIHVVGGNLSSSPGPLVINVTVSGAVKRRRALKREGARPGDELFVTGELGAAAAGLQMLAASPALARARADEPPSSGKTADPCVQRFLFPEPRVRAGVLLGRTAAATACMDLSDGLADAAWQIAEASGVGISIDGPAVPIASSAESWFRSRGEEPLEAALTLGDDYELLFTVRPRSRGRLRSALTLGGVRLTRVGVCTRDAGVVLSTAGRGVQPLPRGFSHFGRPGHAQKAGTR